MTASARWLSIVSLASLAACSMAPAYHPPVAPSVATYKAAAGWTAATPLDDVARGDWWEAFGDSELNALEASADTASPTIAAAIARYDQAVAFANRAGAEQLPIVTADAAVSRNRVSATRPLARGAVPDYTDRQLAAGLDWEIDLWGRLRNGAKAGRAEARASQADLASARLSLHAMIADTYFQLRGLDAEADLLRQTTIAYGRAEELTNTRHEGGIASGLDINRARTQLSDAKARLSEIILQRATSEHALAVLVGAVPSAFSIAPATPDLVPPATPMGMPAELLQRRPDIAAAERRMFAANARVGVARAALFPSLTLGASGGYDTTVGSLLTAPASFWALGPLMAAATIFDGGRRSADVRRARAEFDETSADYRQTVLTAFKDVEDSIAATHYLAAAEQDQNEAAAAAARTGDLAFTRYRDGASDYLEVVVAQTAALDARRSALSLRTRRLQAAVSIIRAFGGGFDAAALQSASLRPIPQPTPKS